MSKEDIDERVLKGDVVDDKENERMTKYDAKELLYELNNSRLGFLFDPLKRLQAFELALIISGLFIIGFSFLQWWLAVVLLCINHAVLTYHYIKDRKEYQREGGIL